MEIVTFSSGIDQSDESHFVQTLQSLTTGQIGRFQPIDIDEDLLKGEF